MLNDQISAEEFVLERRTTVGVRIGDVFRKYYKYAAMADAKREGLYSDMVRRAGIDTPRYLGSGYSVIRKMVYSDFEYHEMEKVDPQDYNTREITTGLFSMLRSLKNHRMKAQEHTWEERYLADLEKALRQLPEPGYAMELLERIKERKNNVLVHGDFSFENIGIDKKTKKLVLFDCFQSCAGPAGWDQAYLLASVPLPTAKVWFGQAKIDMELLRLACAVKFGRGIRKNFELSQRRESFIYWMGDRGKI